MALDEAANDETMLSQMVRVLAHASQGGCNPVRLSVTTSTVCQQLRLLLPHDDEAAAVAKCWEDGVVERDEITKLTGLTEVAYAGPRVRRRDEAHRVL
jgi:hypothetical protein